MAEILKFNMEKIEKSRILDELKLKKDNYFLISIHREENVDNLNNIKTILEALDLIAKKYGYPLVITTHPRTRKRINELGHAR